MWLRDVKACARWCEESEDGRAVHAQVLCVLETEFWDSASISTYIVCFHLRNLPAKYNASSCLDHVRLLWKIWKAMLPDEPMSSKTT